MKKNSYLLILVILLFFLTLGMAIYYFINSSQKKENYLQKGNLESFIREMREISQTISNKGKNAIITGSGALAYILYSLGLFNLLEDMDMPRDLDIIWKGREVEFLNDDMISTFKRQNPKNVRSITFNDISDSERMIKSFDLTRVPSVRFITLDGLNVITPQDLLGYYIDEDDPLLVSKNEGKIAILKELIKILNENEELAEMINYRSDKKRKSSSSSSSSSRSRSLFSDDDFPSFDSDDLSDNDFPKFPKIENSNDNVPSFLRKFSDEFPML